MVETSLFVPYNDGTDKEVVSMMKTGVAVSGAQTTIWLLPQKTSEALSDKASEVFLQNGGNLCNTNQTLALQGFPAWRLDDSDYYLISKG